MTKRFYGLVGRGRVHDKGMNKTEAAYAQHLELLLRAGEIVWFEYESIKLRLAGNTFYTPDFLVMRSDGMLECHEVKGHWKDDARVKIKVAAEHKPFVFKAIKRVKGGWEEEYF